MIYYKKIKNFYYLYSDKDIGMFGPFEGIYYKGKFFGKNFKVENLKTWKNAAGIFLDNIYIFEENNGKLILK